METKKKLNSLVILRGLAVMGVCFGHLGNALGKNNTLAVMFSDFHSYGQYGIYIFFVISGFIIPLSMDKAGYKLRFYFKFLAKRAVRLHPPYLAALTITLVMLAVADKFKHVAFPETFTTILESCFYCHITDNNPVFWTLKVEAEFYIFMGLYFVLMNNWPRLTLLITIPVVLVLSQTHVIDYVSLFSFLPFFFIGTLAYIIYNKSLPFYFAIACLAAIVLFAFIRFELPAAIAGLFTVLAILFYKGKGNAVFDQLGEMSYSIYLIHFPIGVKLINLIYHHINPRYDIVLFISVLMVILGVCALFWKWIEMPFANLSNKIKYGDNKRMPQALTT